MRVRCSGNWKKQDFASSYWRVKRFDDLCGMGNGINGDELLD